MECLGKLSQNMTVLPADKYTFLLEIALEYNRVRIAEGKVTWQGWLPMVAGLLLLSSVSALSSGRIPQAAHSWGTCWASFNSGVVKWEHPGLCAILARITNCCELGEM